MSPQGSNLHRIDPKIALRSPDGELTSLESVKFEKYLVVQLVRYFGCLPCQDWLRELDRSRDDLARRGASATAVGGSADYQAQWLRDERAVAMPLFLDPDHLLRQAVDMTKPLGIRLADPRGVRSYVRSLASGNRPQKITKDTVRSPGVVILDKNFAVVWRHEGSRIGDYPSHQEVLAALEAIQDSTSQ